MRDGQQVKWVGQTGPTHPGVGDTGQVLSSSGASGHVMWSTGARKGTVTLCEDLDVVPVNTRRKVTAVQAAMADSLEVVGGQHLAVRDTFEESGAAGLLNAMASTGHLSGLEPIAEAALEFVASRLRTEPAFAEVLAVLEPAEAESLVTTASMVLLRDSFSPEGD